MAQKTAQHKAPVTGMLNEQDQQVTGKALQETLVDLIDLHLMLKQAHWNVTGSHFRSVHLQLDELVTQARGFADDVAERAIAIGVPVDGRSSTVAEGSSLPRFEGGWRKDHEVVAGVVSALEDAVEPLRERIRQTDGTDLVTQDLLIGIASSLEKAHWMWQAQLAT